MSRLHSSRCRIFLDADLHVGQEVGIPADQAHYLRHVMRLNSGDMLTVFNGRGGEYGASISGLAKTYASCRITDFADISRELPLAVHVIQCANKGEKIETVLQKGTELGASGFQIAISERSQFKLPEGKRESRLERWRKIIVEAAEQSGRTAIPELRYCRSLADIQPHGLALALDPEAAKLWCETRDTLHGVAEVTLAVGPEGGFGERDMAELGKLGFQPLVFGERVMRTETAAPALLAAIAAVV